MFLYIFSCATAIANILLFLLSRNAMFAYFAFICIITAVVNCLPHKISNLSVYIGCGGFSLAIIVNIYCHIMYGALSLDHITIITESAICIVLLLVSLLPKSETQQGKVDPIED